MFLLLLGCAETVLYGGGDGATLLLSGGEDFRAEGELTFAGMGAEDLEAETCDGRVFAEETRSAGALSLVICGGGASVDVVQYTTTRPAVFEAASVTVTEGGAVSESLLQFSQGSTPITATFTDGAVASFDEDDGWLTGTASGEATFAMTGGSTFEWTQDVELSWILDKRPHVVIERKAPFAD